MTAQPITTVLNSSIPPRWLHQISHHGEKIQKAWRAQYYFGSGEDVLVVCKDSETCFTTYTPTSSKIPRDQLSKVVTENRYIIEEQMKLHNIPNRKEFLFDFRTKILLGRDSFIDHIPAWHADSMLFVLDMKEGEEDDLIYEMLDQTREGVLATLSMMMAKQYLIKPKTGDWYDPGKLLLNFLVSNEYRRNVELSESGGAWKVTSMDFSGTEEKTPFVNLDKLKLGKAMTITEKIFRERVVPTNKTEIPLLSDTVIENSEKGIMMSDLIMLGVTAFYNKGYGIFEIELDQFRESFKKLVIDSQAKVCYVLPAAGCTANIDYFRDILQTDDIVFGDPDRPKAIDEMVDDDRFDSQSEMFM